MLYLQPREVYPDPFRAGTHVLVLCDSLAPPPLSDRWPSLTHKRPQHMRQEMFVVTPHPLADFMVLHEMHHTPLCGADGFCLSLHSGAAGLQLHAAV